MGLKNRVTVALGKARGWAPGGRAAANAWRAGLTALVAGTGAVAAELHMGLCLYGCPAGAPHTNDVMVRSIYVLSSNDTTKLADWVAYRVTPDSIGPTAERRWTADSALGEAETLEPDDYRGANAALKTDRRPPGAAREFHRHAGLEDHEFPVEHHAAKSALNQGRGGGSRRRCAAWRAVAARQACTS